MDEEIAVFCGLDAGKSEHHAAVLDRSGERISDKQLPQDEASNTDTRDAFIIADTARSMPPALPSVDRRRATGGRLRKHRVRIPGSVSQRGERQV